MRQASEGHLSTRRVVWGLVIAGVAFIIPLLLNHLVNWFWLHRLHKLLAYLTALLAVALWIAMLRHRVRRPSAG
jgi:hypothetical protein